MVLPVKVFEVRGLKGDPRDKLKGWRETEQVEGEELQLVTEVLDLEALEDTVEARFWIVPNKQRRFLVVMAPSVARGVKKMLSNHVAVKLGEILNADIRESRITSETLQKLHEANPRATNLIWFDQVDIPGVNKLCLSGEGLADTGLYRDYLGHGMIWYVVYTGQKSGYTVGVTRNAVVTNFSKSTEDEFLKFVREELLRLIE
jgi:hypothetical protein